MAPCIVIGERAAEAFRGKSNFGNGSHLVLAHLVLGQTYEVAFNAASLNIHHSSRTSCSIDGQRCLQNCSVNREVFR